MPLVINIKLILIISVLLSSSLYARVSETEFHELSREFISFINPRAQKVVPRYDQKIELKKDSRFLAFGWEPMTISTGLIESPLMDFDSTALIMCHEVGHNLTIARHFTPRNFQYDFIHLEQDYYAVYDCIEPFILESSKKNVILDPIKLSKIPAALKTRCEREHPRPEICLRAISASITALQSIYDSNNVRYRSFGPASFSREWLGANDELQARLLNFIQGIFKLNPFYMGSESEVEEFRL